MVARSIGGLVAAACMTATTVGAQTADTSEFDGRWSVSLTKPGGGNQTATLVIADFAGSWQDQAPAGAAVPKVCRNKKFPITVQVSKPTELEFTVWGSSISRECPDLSVAVKPLGAKTLEGQVNGERAIKLVRR